MQRDTFYTIMDYDYRLWIMDYKTLAGKGVHEFKYFINKTKWYYKCNNVCYVIPSFAKACFVKAILFYCLLPVRYHLN